MPKLDSTALQETAESRTTPEVCEEPAIDSDPLRPLNLLAEQLTEILDADVIVYLGPIDRPFERKVLQIAQRPDRRPNVALVLTTDGGDAHSAYLIARFLQSKYARFTVFIGDRCKSAGTLVALGANEIVMSDQGELGPLDVQVLKKDELGEMSSGLVAMEALSLLETKSFSMFENYLLEIKERSSGLITLKTALKVAGDVTAGLFGPIYQQVDPERLGEVGRAMRIAHQYGTRLAGGTDNLREDTIDRLVAAYPSHGFVIDRQEAAELFNCVREPTLEEGALLDLVNLFDVPDVVPTVVMLPLPSEESEGESSETEAIREDSKGTVEGTGPALGNSGGELGAGVAEIAGAGAPAIDETERAPVGFSADDNDGGEQVG